MLQSLQLQPTFDFTGGRNEKGIAKDVPKAIGLTTPPVILCKPLHPLWYYGTVHLVLVTLICRKSDACRYTSNLLVIQPLYHCKRLWTVSVDNDHCHSLIPAVSCWTAVDGEALCRQSQWYLRIPVVGEISSLQVLPSVMCRSGSRHNHSG